MPKAKTLADKLFVKAGTKVAVVNAPRDLQAVEGAESSRTLAGAGAALVYAVTAKDVAAHVARTAKALGADGRLWVAYPKAGKLGTDLNRDSLWKLVERYGWEGVRLVSIDDTWSGMGFRRKT